MVVGVMTVGDDETAETDDVTETKLVSVGVSWSRIYYVTTDGRLYSHGNELQQFVQVAD